MRLLHTLSEWEVMGMVGHQQPDHDPTLQPGKAKNRVAVNGQYDIGSFFAVEYSRNEELALYQECEEALAAEPGSHITKPHAIQVCKGLWMSDLYTATRVDVLRELKITHIVSIYTRRPRFSKEHRTQAGKELGFWCMHWNWDNKQRQLSPSELHEVQREVTSLLWERQHDPNNQMVNILIHSRTGCRRAAVVALSCVLPSMAPNSLFDAIAKLRACRPGFKPDDSALSLLTRYMSYVGGSKPMKPNDPNRIHLSDLFQRIYPEYSQQTFDVNAYQRAERMIEPQYERPLALIGQSSSVKKEESAIFSEVIVSDRDDGSTEVAEPADVGNALLGDLVGGSTLDVIHDDNIGLFHNYSLYSSGGSFASNARHGSSSLADAGA